MRGDGHLKASPWKMPNVIKENVAILSSVMPHNGDEKKKSKRVYGHQLLPYYESLENVLDEDTYRALEKSWLRNTWLPASRETPLAISSLQSIQMK